MIRGVSCLPFSCGSFCKLPSVVICLNKLWILKRAIIKYDNDLKSLKWFVSMLHTSIVSWKVTLTSFLCRWHTPWWNAHYTGSAGNYKIFTIKQFQMMSTASRTLGVLFTPSLGHLLFLPYWTKLWGPISHALRDINKLPSSLLVYIKYRLVLYSLIFVVEIGTSKLKWWPILNFKIMF